MIFKVLKLTLQNIPLAKELLKLN